jgi:hypothetical protein
VNVPGRLPEMPELWAVFRPGLTPALRVFTLAGIVAEGHPISKSPMDISPPHGLITCQMSEIVGRGLTQEDRLKRDGRN